MTDASVKLTNALKPLIDEAVKTLKENDQLLHQNLLLQFHQLVARIDVLEKIVAEKKKPIRGDKKEKPAAEGGVEQAPADPAAIPPIKTKTFYLNKMVWFKETYKHDPAFKNEYVTPVIQELIDKEPGIQGRKDATQKTIAEAAFVWTYIKNNLKEVYNAIETEFKRKREEFDAANRPQQQVPEKHTPEQTAK